LALVAALLRLLVLLLAEVWALGVWALGVWVTVAAEVVAEVAA
jgi:hypothetical protein